LRPVYVPAHHTHPVLLDAGELLDELRLNAEAIHERLSAPVPARRGLFFTECSIDRRLVPAVEAMGIDYTFCPALDAEKLEFTVDDPDHDALHAPFRVGRRLIAFQRHYPVSQEVWRPLTRRFAARVRYQGFFVGEMPVFADEYQEGRPAEPEDDPAAGVEAYARVLRQAIGAAPDGGVIVYLQDLELMDFGEAALGLIGAAWDKVRAEEIARLEFTSPDQVLVEDEIEPEDLPAVHFERASWAPELRPSLRSDGHYPPRHAGPFHGIDAGVEIFRRRPFVFWEAGRFITTVLSWLLDAFGHARATGVAASVLFDEDYRLERFPPSVRLPMLLRLSKRACNYGWYPEEGLHKRPYLDGYLICEGLRMQLISPGAPPRVLAPLADWALAGLRRMPELIVEPRIEYLTFGLERLREQRGQPLEAAFLELEAARAERRRADDEWVHARAALLELGAAGYLGVAPWTRLLVRLRDHMAAVFLALDHLQRTWGHGDPEFLVGAMYRYLFDLYPPRGPQVLDEVLAAADLEARAAEEVG
jgi:hypothetical protein